MIHMMTLATILARPILLVFPKDSFHGEILPGESSVNVHTEAANFTLVKSRESKHSSWLVSAKSLYSPF